MPLGGLIKAESDFGLIRAGQATYPRKAAMAARRNQELGTAQIPEQQFFRVGKSRVKKTDYDDDDGGRRLSLGWGNWEIGDPKEKIWNAKAYVLY